jgi:hypothetical protein
MLSASSRMVVRALETMRKVYLRLPYIDRINVSFAALTVRGDLEMSAGTFGSLSALLGLFPLRDTKQCDPAKDQRQACGSPGSRSLGGF